jgi:hypothetical protein
VGAPGASAAPFAQSYPFSGAASGSAGWASLDNPAPNPWYVSSIGAGGLRMAPTGNGGLIYDNAYRSGFELQAPAGATITRAVLSGVDALQQDRQRTRINLLPQPSTGALDGTESWGRSTTDDGDTLTGTLTLTPQAGSTATGVQIRHYPVACGDPGLGQPACAPVPTSTTAHARVAAVDVTLDDPSAPSATVAGPAGGWTNATSAPITASGADAQSGISRLALRVRAGSSTRTQTLGTWDQDTSGSSLPGWSTTRDASSSVTLPRSGTVTITAIARNGANTESASAPVIVRIDRVAPKITWPKRLQGGQTATVRDAASGLGTVTATIGGKAVKVTCAAGAEQCKVGIPTTARGRIRIGGTDQAGNSTVAERDVVPGGKAGASGGGGSGKGSGKRGSRKPTASYCKKHPRARACAGSNPGRGGQGRPGRAAPRGIKLSKAGGKPASKDKVPGGCKQRRLTLTAAGSFAVNNFCTGDKVLSRGDTFAGPCQGKNSKGRPYGRCRYQVQAIRPHAAPKGSYYCAVVPLDRSNANPGPKGTGIGTAPKGRKRDPAFRKGKSRCNREIRDTCEGAYKNCKKALVAAGKAKCKGKRYYIPVAAVAEMTNGSPDAAKRIPLNAAYIAARRNQLPVCAGVNPMGDLPKAPRKHGRNASGPADEHANRMCSESVAIDPAGAFVQWRWITKDGKYVMSRVSGAGGRPVFGASHWAFIPVEAIIGAPAPSSPRARAVLLCSLSPGSIPEGQTAPTIKNAGRDAMPAKNMHSWGNVSVCSDFDG